MSEASVPLTSDDDPIRPHPQRVAYKLALWDMTDTLDVGRPGLHLHDVWLLQAKFDGVFDRDNALVSVDMARHRIQQRCFARASAAGDQHIDSAPCGDVEELRHRRR